jgi:lysozyme
MSNDNSVYKENEMQISHAGVEFLKDREGFRAKAYRDTAGVWTIGYGTIKVDGKPVQEGMTCTQDQATVWLLADLSWAQTAVNQLVKVALTQGQFDALTSFVYNLGVGNFSKSTLLRKINDKDFSGASKEFEKWVMSGGRVTPGLVSRRHMEEEMFQT